MLKLYINLKIKGDVYTISAYFTDPIKVCTATTRQPTGDRLVIKSNQQEINVALKESEVASFWTKGQCFWTMVQKFFLIYDKIYFKFYSLSLWLFFS